MKDRLRSLLPCLLLAVAASCRTTRPQAPARALHARVGPLSGPVQVQFAGSDVWTLLKAGQILPDATRIKTEAGASCVLVFPDGSQVRIGPQAAFQVEEVGPSQVAVFIGLGKLEAWVSRTAGLSFQARSPVSVVSSGGGVFAVDVLSPTSATIDCFTGALTARDTLGNTSSVGQGQRMEANAASGAAAPAPIPAGGQPPPAPEGFKAF